jgi:hypothetical protein
VLSVSSLRVLETCGPDVLDKFGRPLDVLAQQLHAPVSCRLPWLSPWLAAYPDYVPWAITAWQENQLEGAVLFAYRRVGPSLRITAIGHGRNDRTRLLASDRPVAQLLARCIVTRLRKVRPPWELRVEQLPVDDPVALAIVEGMPEASLVPGGSVPGVDFAHNRATEYHLSTNLRRQLGKCRNRISTDGVEVVTEFIRDRTTLLAHLPQVEYIHRTRDHEVGRRSDLDDPAIDRLWRGIITAHIDRDQVELGTMRIDGNLAAYVLSFMDGVTYRVFDGRFLTRWMRYSPGRLLEVEMLAHAMKDRRFQRLDWMNSIAPNKLISANTLEPTATLIASVE